MGFRLIPIGGAGIHEGIAIRGSHKVAVTGTLCALLNACAEARAHAVLAEDGVAWIPYWLALLLSLHLRSSACRGGGRRRRGVMLLPHHPPLPFFVALAEPRSAMIRRCLAPTGVARRKPPYRALDSDCAEGSPRARPSHCVGGYAPRP